MAKNVDMRQFLNKDKDRVTPNPAPGKASTPPSVATTEPSAATQSAFSDGSFQFSKVPSGSPPPASPGAVDASERSRVVNSLQNARGLSGSERKYLESLAWPETVEEESSEGGLDHSVKVSPLPTTPTTKGLVREPAAAFDSSQVFHQDPALRPPFGGGDAAPTDRGPNPVLDSDPGDSPPIERADEIEGGPVNEAQPELDAEPEPGVNPRPDRPRTESHELHESHEPHPEPKYGSPAPTECPYCKWDLRASSDIEITMKDKLEFVHAAEGLRPFKKRYDILDGNIEVVIRSLTIGELDEIYRQITRDREREKFKNEFDMQEQFNRYRTVLQVLEYTTSEHSHVLPDGLSKDSNPLAKTAWDSGFESVEEKLVAIEKWVSSNILVSESLGRIITRLVSDFNRHVSKMEVMAMRLDFWTGEES